MESGSGGGGDHAHASIRADRCRRDFLSGMKQGIAFHFGLGDLANHENGKMLVTDSPPSAESRRLTDVRPPLKLFRGMAVNLQTA
jgi:hypothetical protein